MSWGPEMARRRLVAASALGSPSVWVAASAGGVAAVAATRWGAGVGTTLPAWGSGSPRGLALGPALATAWASASGLVLAWALAKVFARSSSKFAAGSK